MGSGRFWTRIEIAELGRLLAAGASHKQIGKALGRSTEAVTQKAHKLGLPTDPEASRRHKAAAAREAAARPEVAARRRAAAQKRWARADERERVSRQSIENNNIAYAAAARATEYGKRRFLEGVKKRVDRALSWCPEHLRDEYRKLRKYTLAAEARRIILERHGYTALHPAPPVIRSTILEAQADRAPAPSGGMQPPPGYADFKHRLGPVRTMYEARP